MTAEEKKQWVDVVKYFIDHYDTLKWKEAHSTLAPFAYNINHNGLFFRISSDSDVSKSDIEYHLYISDDNNKWSEIIYDKDIPEIHILGELLGGTTTLNAARTSFYNKLADMLKDEIKTEDILKNVWAPMITLNEKKQDKDLNDPLV